MPAAAFDRTAAERKADASTIACPRCGITFKFRDGRLRLCGDCKNTLTPSERMAWI